VKTSSISDSASDLSQEKKILHLCQENKEEEARKLLLACGYQYRLAKEVLHYTLPTSDSIFPSSKENKYVVAIDNALPLSMLQYMQDKFQPDSFFWSEHDYANLNTGYFSYLYSLRGEPSNGLEQVIQHIWKLVIKYFPQVKTATIAEWWAHCRPHPDGHQLHFDSENEGQGVVRHPLVSIVLYLSEGIGGPTLVTNQKLGGTLGTEGWIVFPKVNRLTMFDASVLHGVIPGRGPNPDPTKRRISFMIGFWTSITPHPRDDGKPGAAQPFPISKEKKWVQSVIKKNKKWESNLRSSSFASPIALPRVWENVEHPQQPIPLTFIPPYQSCFQGF